MQSSLSDLLQQKRKSVLDHWFQGMLESFEKKTAFFLKAQSDRFANPGEHAMRTAAEAIYQALVNNDEVDLGALDYAIKLRAVQENDPAKGIAFVHQLKDALRKDLADALPESELTRLNSRIDEIASVASELFAINRAKIAELAGRNTSGL